MTPTSDERERKERDNQAHTYAYCYSKTKESDDYEAAFISGWDSHREWIQYGLKNIEQVLSRVASETEARVRAETIRECARVCAGHGGCCDFKSSLASNRSREGGK